MNLGVNCETGGVLKENLLYAAKDLHLVVGFMMSG